mmetsp:Transcript_2581/g.6921  ORF Transcript_2581/g.6921 Transcript_2581/m.6921 type:complete len:254 (-) Transcript_2581:475-1236(-)
MLGLPKLPRVNVEVLETLASLTVHHFHVDPAESRPRHSVGPVARLREEGYPSTLVRPSPRYSHSLEKHLRARIAQAPCVGLQMQQRILRTHHSRYLQQDDNPRPVDVKPLAIHVGEVGVAHARDWANVGATVWWEFWRRCRRGYNHGRAGHDHGRHRRSGDDQRLAAPVGDSHGIVSVDLDGGRGSSNRGGEGGGSADVSSLHLEAGQHKDCAVGELHLIKAQQLAGSNVEPANTQGETCDGDVGGGHGQSGS